MNAVIDVNVALPLILEQHSQRAVASAWWAKQPDQSVVFTIPVRMAVLRLLTNRALMGGGVLKPEQAWSVMTALLADARSVVRNDAPAGLDLYWISMVRGRDPSPNLWIDAWLAAFAEAEGMQMVTFDRDFRKFSLSHLRLLNA